MASAERRGFAVLQAVLALAVAGIVLLAARMLIESLMDGAERVNGVSSAIDREANGRQLMRALVARMEVTDTSRLFAGDERAIVADSWCETPFGGTARCRLSLRIANDSVLAIVDGASATTVMQSGPRAEFRYLADGRDGGTWIRHWGHSLTMPLAIVLVRSADTVFFPIGDRG